MRPFPIVAALVAGGATFVWLLHPWRRIGGVAKVPPIHVHVHIDLGDVLSARLEQMESRIMAELSEIAAAQQEAITAAVGRITADFDNLRAIAEEALATETAATAEVAALQQKIDDAAASFSANTDALNAVDPDPNFPAAPPEEPPVEEPPVDGGEEPAPPV